MEKIIDRIEAKLRLELTPSALEIEDFSAQHAGHAGARAGGESHFRVRVRSPRFEGLGKVEQHRLVYQILSLELSNDIHALVLDTGVLNK